MGSSSHLPSRSPGGCLGGSGERWVGLLEEALLAGQSGAETLSQKSLAWAPSRSVTLPQHQSRLLP